MNNRKGVSDVVAVVLIIMITVAAIGIIWGAIIPMVTKSVGGSTACFNAQSDISLLSTGYTCINNNIAVFNNTTSTISGADIAMQVHKGENTEISLVAVQAVISDSNGNSWSYRLNRTNSIYNYSQNTTGASGNLPGNNEDKTLHVWGPALANMTQVKVAPIITVGKTEQVCPASQAINLAACA